MSCIGCEKGILHHDKLFIGLSSLCLRYDEELGVVYMAARLAGGYAAVRRAINEVPEKSNKCSYFISHNGTAFAECQFPALLRFNLYAPFENHFPWPSQIKKRDPTFAPSTLLDFGSGLGTVVW